MKKFILMKYEMLLANLFDFIVKLLRKTRMNWYPEFILGYEYGYEELFDKYIDAVDDTLYWKDQCHDLDNEIDNLEWTIICQDNEIERLEAELEKYEAER